MILKKNCEICSKHFNVQSSRLKTGRGRFCSRTCVNTYRKGQLAEKNPCWRGGRVMRHGYWFIYKPDHPYAKNHRYIQEHRYVMEQKLGRILKPTELVHHINHIKTDNRPENLDLIDKAHHSSHHSAGVNNPMYGITRDHGLGHLSVKIPAYVIEAHREQDSDFINLPFSVIQKYLNNIRDIPVNGQPWGRSK